YQLTPFGREIAVFFTKTYSRVLTPGLALLDPALPPEIARRCPLATTWRDFAGFAGSPLCRQGLNLFGACRAQLEVRPGGSRPKT
ncbi:MAG: hypothetical protein ACRDJ4_05970, partial [Actinomycetota bacterium]